MQQTNNIDGSVVRVFSLATDEELTFVGLSPEEAVVAAFEQDRGNRDTTTYPHKLTQYKEAGGLVYGLASVAMGDFATVVRPGKPH